MNPAVGNQLLQRQTGNLPPHRLKAGNGNGLGGVVNDQIHARQRFNGADVAALPANDAALHLVIGQGNHTDGHFGHLIGGAPLDGLGNNFPGLGVALLFHARLHFLDLHGRLVGYFGLHLVNKVLLRFVGGEAGDALQHLRVAALDRLNLLALPVYSRVLLGQRILFLLYGLHLTIQVFFLLLQPVFLPLQVCAAGLLFLLILAAVFQNLFLGFQQGFLFLGLCALNGLVDNALSLFFSA